MATQFQIIPPGKFSFKGNIGKNGSRDLNIGEKPQSVRINTLIYCMGDREEEFFNCFEFPPAPVPQEKEEEAVDWKQREGETVDEYITGLYLLAGHCNYGNLKEELIRDCIVVGIRDKKLQRKLQLIEKEDEMACLIKGCNFLLKNIPDEAFAFVRHGNPEYQFQTSEPNIFPYLLLNVGSGVSIVKVESEDKYERIGGTAMGGGTFLGLGSLLTNAKEFDDLLNLAVKGDHRNVDMLVKDIYGGAYSALGLPGDLLASSFGKTVRNSKQATGEAEEDIAKSLLHMISNDIGQIACLYANLHGLKKCYFGGYFIRGQPVTMSTITFAMNYWSKGEVQGLFLRHEGYLGAIGAFLKGAEEDDTVKYQWGENYAGSSGLTCSSPPPYGKFATRGRSGTFDMLELDRLDHPLVHLPKLRDPGHYHADTVDLTKDTEARIYWLDCFEEAIDRVAKCAVKSQPNSEDSQERAQQFIIKYRKRLQELREQPFKVAHPVRKSVKVSCVFGISGKSSATDTSCTKTSSRSPMVEGQPHKLAIIFVDNSGADVILGVFPLVKELLNRGTEVILSANSGPALNDITHNELRIVIKRVTELDSDICLAVDENRLTLLESGSASPCLDLSRVDQELAEQCRKADLLIFEGMGRAVHTNLEASFTCESLKLAVLKNKWLANRLGGEAFSVMFKYER
uniref:4'-phosphopantetheine phosphatase n=1 Tax=Saccoglossus kowalevskii TaxID=10224 RepID=A0ABM0MV05_SACKO|nr:PREDICTED: pantothenate kinase 4-like [Saccoglossus kowalevskii]